MKHLKIPFNKPYMTGKEAQYIKEASDLLHLSGNGPFTQKCHDYLKKITGSHAVFLTTSCTAGLEMAAILADIGPGDEVILPSYTFVSTANAFVLRGAVPIFVDIREDTLNIDEACIEKAITSKTKAICPVHYGGVGCEIETIMGIAKKYNLKVIEDAAQAMVAKSGNKHLGSIGHFGALSFHETKNIISGEGGALLVNDPDYEERAQIIWEKGTNRTQFFRGEVDRYTWMDIGSSYLPSEIIAAFLWAQLEESERITKLYLEIWDYYNELFEELEKSGSITRPTTPKQCNHNAHMYYLLLENKKVRETLRKQLEKAGIGTVFHYTPLHSSPAGKRYGRTSGELTVTDDISDRILRLPMWIGLSKSDIEFITENVAANLKNIN